MNSSPSTWKGGLEANIYNIQIVYYCVFSESVAQRVLKAVEASPSGIASLDVLESLGLCGPATLRVTLSRLGRGGRIVRLKRGTYSASPIRDAFASAQAVFNGYIGLSSALYLHRLISEVPFTVTVVTARKSGAKRVGGYEFRAVALGGKAVGFERKGPYVVSTRAKTLFDCLYLPKYAVEPEKLISAFREARLGKEERLEFLGYVEKFASAKARTRILKAAKQVW